jgi:hypothetical protein
MLSDPQFVPLFGKSLTAMSPRERKGIHDTLRRCFPDKEKVPLRSNRTRLLKGSTPQ